MLTFPFRPAPRRTKLRFLVGCALVAAAGSVVSTSGCKGLTSIDASFVNTTDSLDFYPLNDAAPGAPTAIDLFSQIHERADQNFAYDIAFDLTPDGRVLLIPSRALATGFSSPYSVGLQKIPNVAFAAVDRAPKDGYVVDSTLAVGIGTTVVIESHDFTRCASSIKGQSYFSKLVVTAIDSTTRKISTIVEVNRNCGFRSFADGKPTD